MHRWRATSSTEIPFSRSQRHLGLAGDALEMSECRLKRIAGECEKHRNDKPKGQNHHTGDAKDVAGGIVIRERLPRCRTWPVMAQDFPPMANEILPEREVEPEQDQQQADHINDDDCHRHVNILYSHLALLINKRSRQAPDWQSDLFSRTLFVVENCVRTVAPQGSSRQCPASSPPIDNAPVRSGLSESEWTATVHECPNSLKKANSY